MNSPSPHQIVCHVIGGNKLPTSAGTADSICAAIVSAAAAHAPSARFSVEVRVLGRSALAATLTTADGKTLPEQRFASSDRPLNPDSIEFFAKSLVETARAGDANLAFGPHRD